MQFYQRLLFILFVISTTLLCGAAYLYNPKKFSVNSSLLVFLLLIISILIFALILVLSSRFLEQEQKRYQLEQQLQKQEMDLAYYKDVSLLLAQISKLRHDFKNHLILIASYITHHEFPRALDYIQKLSEISHSDVEEVFTNDETVSAILNVKRQQCQKLLIPFSIKLSFPKIYHLEDLHIVSILGNLLDNAITATKNLPEAQRFVALHIVQLDSYLEIVCKNTFNGTIQKDTDGSLLTTKHSKDSHGLGLRIIKDTVDKYAGDFFMDYDESSFCIKILIPNHE